MYRRDSPPHPPVSLVAFSYIRILDAIVLTGTPGNVHSSKTLNLFLTTALGSFVPKRKSICHERRLEDYHRR
jgi:hypothetical protein